jgi:multidrug efflux pump subunit AcrA (membrane-fusion protein)
MYPVRIVLPNNSRKYPLRSGMYGKVTFNLPSQTSLTIPRTALLGSVNTPQVFVVEGGKAVQRDLVIGATVDNKIVVLQGLNEGETVVTSGQENLKDGIAVDIMK